MANPDIEVVNQTDTPVEKKEFKFNPYCKDFDAPCDTVSYESKESYNHFSYDPVFNVGTYYDLMNLYYPGSDPESPWMFENDAYSDATYLNRDSPTKDFKFSPSAKEFIVSISRETMLALRPEGGRKLDVKLCFTQERFQVPTSDKTEEKKRGKRKEDYYERAYNGRYPKYGYTNQKARDWWYYSY